MTPKEEALRLIKLFKPFSDSFYMGSHSDARELFNTTEIVVHHLQEMIKEKETFEPFGSRIEFLKETLKEIESL